MTLWSPNRHEPVCTTPWNEPAALDAMRTIAREAIEIFSETKLWPAHPDDLEDIGTDAGLLQRAIRQIEGFKEVSSVIGFPQAGFQIVHLISAAPKRPYRREVFA